MKNFIQLGHTLSVVAKNDTRAGDIYVEGALKGIALCDMVEGQNGVISTEGVYSLPRVFNDEIKSGEIAYLTKGLEDQTQIENIDKWVVTNKKTDIPIGIIVRPRHPHTEPNTGPDYAYNKRDFKGGYCHVRLTLIPTINNTQKSQQKKAQK